MGRQFQGTVLEAITFIGSLRIELEEMIDSKAYCFYHIGLVYKTQGKLELALKNFDEAIILINSCIRKPTRSFIYRKLVDNKRSTLFGLGRIEEAKVLKSPNQCM